jgi:hypothetical protein
MNPESIDEWFPIEQQRKYVSGLKEKMRVGLTRRRAEYFIKLWAYLFLKQQLEQGKELQPPITELALPEGFVVCTHREAQDLFYSQTDRGSDRAAGMMIDKLMALGLIEKEFDGNTIRIRIHSPLPNFQESTEAPESVELVADVFNPRTDAIPVATLLARYYNWMKKHQPYPTELPEFYVLGQRSIQRGCGCYAAATIKIQLVYMFSIP